MNSIEKAIEIALKAHSGQVDKGGCPYILHPFTVANNQNTYEGFIVGMLHDVVEDSEYTFEDLKNEGFSDEILEALKLLTHDKNVDYLEYVSKLKRNELARLVKLADLAHNSNLSRLKTVTEKDIARVEKYKKAMSILNDV